MVDTLPTGLYQLSKYHVSVNKLGSGSLSLKIILLFVHFRVTIALQV